MTLFDNIVRTNLGPKGETQSVFSFLNQSAEPYVQRIRDLMEVWFHALPSSGHTKTQLKGRFRSRRNDQHYGAVFELYCYALLFHHGYQVIVEPVTDEQQGTRPDFEVLQGKESLFYIECSQSVSATENRAAETRLGQVVDILNGLESPDFFLSIHVAAIGSRPLRTGPLRSFLLEKIKDLRYEDLVRGSPHEWDRRFVWQWQDADWELEFRPNPKFVTRGKSGIRTIGTQTGRHQGGVVDSRSPLLKILNAKYPGYYGRLERPYVLAANVTDLLFDETEIKNVLFGTDPLFNARNSDVSALLIAYNLKPWSVATAIPVLWHNPYASSNLDPSLWKLPQAVFDLDTSELKLIDGCKAWELLDLEPDWPRRGKP